MDRPSLEMADIIRNAGQRFIERNRHWITGQHLKVLRAIECCRTAVLGGHLRSHPKLRFSCPSSTCNSFTAVRSITRIGPADSLRSNILRYFRSRSVDLSEMWWANGNRRPCRACNNTTALSTMHSGVFNKCSGIEMPAFREDK